MEIASEEETTQVDNFAIKSEDSSKEEILNIQDPIKLHNSVHSPMDVTKGRIDFIGVESFDVIFNIHLIDLVNQLKISLKKILHNQFMEISWGLQLKKLRYSKYLFI